MSREDRIKGILQEAGVESAVRRPAEVIDLPVRSAFLNRTANRPTIEAEAPPEAEVPPGAYIWPEWIKWPVRLQKYLWFACVAVGLLMVFSWARTKLILADVGGKACAVGPINIPDYSCELDAVACFTVPQEALVSGVKEQAHARNMALVGCAEL